MTTKHGLAWLLLPALLGLATASQAQYLRAGGSTFASSLGSSDGDIKDPGWISASSATVITQETSSSIEGAYAHMQFAAGFGVLRSSLNAGVTRNGEVHASASGIFGPSPDYMVGASFYDTITLGGLAGTPVSLRVDTSLHSVLSVPTHGYATVQLEVDAFSVDSVPSGRISPGPIVHEGAGERTSTGSFTIHGLAGQSFDLSVELSSFVSVFTPLGESGIRLTTADASHTGQLTITALSGSFTSASGATYASAVPEPASYLSLALGLAMLAMRTRRRGGSETE